MGIYYQVACDATQERIDPGGINDLGIKADAIAYPKHPFGPVVIYAMLTRWSGKSVRLVNDLGDDPGYFDYADITGEIIAEYNKKYGTNLVHTPMVRNDPAP